MPTTTITVTYQNGVINAPNVTISTPGATVLQWVPGTGVKSIDSISGLTNPPFSPPQASNNGFQSTDTNNATSPTTYNYTIGYTLSDEHLTSGRHDPQITNEPG
jgi:hypothetical protein